MPPALRRSRLRRWAHPGYRHPGRRLSCPAGCRQCHRLHHHRRLRPRSDAYGEDDSEGEVEAASRSDGWSSSGALTKCGWMEQTSGWRYARACSSARRICARAWMRGERASPTCGSSSWAGRSSLRLGRPPFRSAPALTWKPWMTRSQPRAGPLRPFPTPLLCKSDSASQSLRTPPAAKPSRLYPRASCILVSSPHQSRGYWER